MEEEMPALRWKRHNLHLLGSARGGARGALRKLPGDCEMRIANVTSVMKCSISIWVSCTQTAANAYSEAETHSLALVPNHFSALRHHAPSL